MTEYRVVEAKGLSTETAYRLIIGCVVPRPIAWITTISPNGIVNAAPFSSFNYVAHTPPMLAVNIATRAGKLKDSARNIVATREFVVNVATEPAMETLHKCGADYPYEESEPEKVGFETLPSVHVKPPRIAASPIHMECTLDKVVPLGKGLNTLYIGEVVAFHLSTEIYDGKYVDSIKMRPIARLGGPYYAGLGEIWHRPMLQAPPTGEAPSLERPE